MTAKQQMVTAKMKGVDPQDCLANVLTRIAAHSACRDDLRESRLNRTGYTASLTEQKAIITPAAQAGWERRLKTESP